MSKPLFLLGLLIICVSCSQKNPEETVQENLKAYIEENAKDPSSYEPIETELVDTIFLGEIASLKIEEYKNSNKLLDEEIFDAEYKIKETELKLEDASSEELQNVYNQIIDNRKEVIKLDKESIYKNNDYLKKLEGQSTSDSIMYFTFIHKCRLKNGFGALDLSNYVVTTDPEMNIRNVTGELTEAVSFVLAEFDETHNIE